MPNSGSSLYPGLRCRRRNARKSSAAVGTCFAHPSSPILRYRVLELFVFISESCCCNIRDIKHGAAALLGTGRHNMTATRTHPLLIKSRRLTETTYIWTLKDHPHTVIGSRRGFEVRVYHYPAENQEPYFVTVTSKWGWVMDATHSPTAAAAEAEAFNLLG